MPDRVRAPLSLLGWALIVVPFVYYLFQSLTYLIDDTFGDELAQRAYYLVAGNYDVLLTIGVGGALLGVVARSAVGPILAAALVAVLTLSTVVFGIVVLVGGTGRYQSLLNLVVNMVLSVATGVVIVLAMLLLLRGRERRTPPSGFPPPYGAPPYPPPGPYGGNQPAPHQMSQPMPQQAPQQSPQQAPQAQPGQPPRPPGYPPQ